MSILPSADSGSQLSALEGSASDAPAFSGNSASTSDLRPLTSGLGRPISYKLVHTGQHYDEKMSEVFFRELGIPAPDINLEVGSGSHAVQTANIMTRFEPVLLSAFKDDDGCSAPPSSISDLPSSRASAPPPSDLCPSPSASSSISNLPSPTPSASALRPPTPGSGPSPNSHLLSSAPSALPDWLIVVGDVNSTMACTLVASKLGVKVAHVEAGLRSFDRTMPEEVNRLVTDALADLLLTPSEDASENLRREGVPDHKVRLVGNVMIDALVANLPQARQSCILRTAGVTAGRFVYVTLHRPSNVDHPGSLTTIMGELKRIASEWPVVFPMHPRTRKMCGQFGVSLADNPGLRIVEPIGYHDSLCLAESARFILTDSGGLQEESTFFGTPCLTLRPNTERPVTITMGSNQLTALPRLRSDIDRVLGGQDRVGRVPPLWEGRAADRTVESVIGASGAD